MKKSNLFMLLFLIGNMINAQFTKLYDLSWANGAKPSGSFMQASDGMLYGLLAEGGANSSGTFFQFNPSTNAFTKKFDFTDISTNATGKYPLGSFMQASDGMLYGTTIQGGVNGYGVLFQYNPATNTYAKKLDFAGTANGKYPYGNLIQASNGLLYGVASGGGTSNSGVLFQYNASTSTYTKKYDFASTNGVNPEGSLIQASDGMLYGMTYQGGASNLGVLFQYNPATNTFTKKIDFAGTANGSRPQGSLVQASDGMLYGMTTLGGANNLGVLFQYDPATNTLTKKLDFAGTTNGTGPRGSLIQVSNGLLCGMTFQGGANNLGVLFYWNTTTNTYTKQLDFAGSTNGSNPQGDLFLASDGMLYGMTFLGGTNSYGTLFKTSIPTNCTANAGPNVTDYSSGGVLCAGVQIGTSSVSGLNYAWTPASDLSCANCAQPICTYNNTTPQVYTVSVSGTGCFAATSTVQVKTVAQHLTASITNINAINGSNINAIGHYSANFTPTSYSWSITQCTSTGGAYPGGYTWNSGSISGAPSGVFTFPNTASLPCNTYYRLTFWTGNSCVGQSVQSAVIYTTLNANTVVSTAMVSTGNHSVTATYPSGNPAGISYWWYVAQLDGNQDPIPATEAINPSCWWTYPASTAPNSFKGYQNNAYDPFLCAAGTVGNFTSPNYYRISFAVWSSTCAWTQKNITIAFCGSGCRTGDPDGVITTESDSPSYHSYFEAMAKGSLIDGQNNMVDVFPNPSIGNFTIATASNMPQLIQIFDVNGKIVFSQNINDRANIEVNNLSDGIYSIKITGNNSITNKKLVIAR